MLFTSPLFFALFAISLSSAFAAVDDTFTEFASGIHVVDAVIWKLRSSGIFPEDFNLLHRLAWSQTKFGDERTDGGIWGLSEAAFNFTINSIQPDMVDKINSAFDIKWIRPEVVYGDSALPLVSGLAASIHIAINRKELLLQTISEQANFLLTQQIIQNATAYTLNTEILEAGIACRVPFDITLLIGGSASQSSTFQNTTDLEKQFAKGLFASFEKSDLHSRFSLVAINGDSIETRFTLDSPYNKYEIERIVGSTGFSNLTNTNITRINEEIKVGVDTMNGTARRGASLPRLLVTFSHRESSEDGGVSNIAYARQLFLQLHTVTIGQPITEEHERELMNLASQKQNVWITDTNGLPELYRQFSKKLCSLQLSVQTNTAYNGRLAVNEKRYHYFSTSDDYDYSLTLMSDGSSGLTAYFSYLTEFPSSAIHDYSRPVTGAEIFLPHAPAGTARTYVTIQNNGTQDLSYSLVLQVHPYVPTTVEVTTSTQPPTTSQSSTPAPEPSAASFLLVAPISFIIGASILQFVNALSV